MGGTPRGRSGGKIDSMMGRMEPPRTPCPAARLALLFLAVPFLSGCLSSGLAVAGLVSGLTDSSPTRISQGTRAQNGKGFDKSIGQALAQADAETSPACETLLPESKMEDGDLKTCNYRLVCFPGALQPVEVMICRKNDMQND